MKSKEGKCVLILSGGVDSTTLLYDLLNQGYDVHAISYDYGQKHSRELNCAIETCNKLKVKHKVLNLRVLNEVAPSALTRDDIEVPHGEYAKENIKLTVVPHRNLIMISLASAYAESINAKNVFYGAHCNDAASYWDTRPDFYKALNNVLKLNDIFPVKLKAPYLNLFKADVIKRGIKFGVDYSLSWSCYSPKGNRPCLKCSTCIERIESFLRNNVKDSLLTNEEWRRVVENYEEVMRGN